MNTIQIYFIIVPILAIVLLISNLLFAVHRPDSDKVTPYECGFSPIYGQTRNPFQVSFYLVGILFLVFDIEILITFPYSVTIYITGIYGFTIFLLFFFVLTIGFVYEIGKGALYFTDHRSSSPLSPLKVKVSKVYLSWVQMVFCQRIANSLLGFNSLLTLL